MNLRKEILGATLLAALPFSGWGAERITLRNGFALTCDHHAQVQDRMRLYLGSGGDNFIEFPSKEIAAVESLPDITPPAAATSASVPATDDQALSPADLHQMLARAGKEHNIDIDLLASVVKAESDGNPKALSRAGAQGLMQLMPATADKLGVEDSYKADQNVRGGSAYLDSLLIRFHDNMALALAAYNAGPEAVERYRSIPPYRETQVYVARVIHEFNRRVLAREAAQKAARDR